MRYNITRKPPRAVNRISKITPKFRQQPPLEKGLASQLLRRYALQELESGRQWRVIGSRQFPQQPPPGRDQVPPRVISLEDVHYWQMHLFAVSIKDLLQRHDLPAFTVARDTYGGQCEVKISPDGDDISCIRCIRKRLQCEYIGVEEQESREWSQGSAVPVSRYPNGQSHSGRYGSSHPYYPPDAQHPAGPSKIGHGGGGAPYSQMYSTMGPSEGFHPQHAQYAQPRPSQRWAYGEQRCNPRPAGEEMSAGWL
ncbi:hypothetical protein C8F01DRAFT_1090400 [Mycena amicta]|nr:hypothetical protein C8F01DRAFT_1090400 [Mycena amicta]